MSVDQIHRFSALLFAVYRSRFTLHFGEVIYEVANSRLTLNSSLQPIPSSAVLIVQHAISHRDRCILFPASTPCGGRQPIEIRREMPGPPLGISYNLWPC
jgi:hypothetical protein